MAFVGLQHHIIEPYILNIHFGQAAYKDGFLCAITYHVAYMKIAEPAALLSVTGRASTFGGSLFSLAGQGHGGPWPYNTYRKRMAFGRNVFHIDVADIDLFHDTAAGRGWF